jgi:hypothetical protein
MDMSYEVPDYSNSGLISKKREPQKMKEVYPQLEIRGEAALKFLKNFPDLKLGEKLKGNVVFIVCGMKRYDKLNSEHVSDYDNCVTLDFANFTSPRESTDGDETTMEDFEKAKSDESDDNYEE